MATASHELKTPLTSISLPFTCCWRKPPGHRSKRVEMLLDARENYDRLLAMVNNLLIWRGWKG